MWGRRYYSTTRWIERIVHMGSAAQDRGPRRMRAENALQQLRQRALRASYLPSICSQDGRRGASPSGPYACKKLTRGQWNGVRGPDLSAMQPLDMRHPRPQIAYTQGGPYSRVELPLWNCGKHSQTQGLVVARHDDGTVSAYHGACRARTSTSWKARSV